MKMLIELEQGIRQSRSIGAMIVLAVAFFVTGCSTSSTTQQTLAGVGQLSSQAASFNPALIYAATYDGDVPIPAFDYTKMDPDYLRQVSSFPGSQPAGSIVVDSSKKYLYFVLPGKKAIRYGIAVGKEGYAWYGDSIMKWKQPWPTWTPPAEMIARTPKLAEFEEGMPGGSDNPLGARALYLFKDGRDTLFRIHGTNRPYSIGKAASSGCFRMINQDVIDLYSRVKPGTRVYVKQRIEERQARR